jgi:hypothetical protein
VLPRLADVSDLRKAICQLLTPPPKLNLPDTSPRDMNQQDIANIMLPEHVTLLDCYQEGGLVRTILNDRDSVLQLIDTISKSPSAPFSIPVPRSETQFDIGGIHPGPGLGGDPAEGRHRSESISLANQDDPDSTQAQNEDFTGGMILCCLAVESPKDLSFVLNIPPARLASRNASDQATSRPTSGQPRVTMEKVEEDGVTDGPDSSPNRNSVTKGVNCLRIYSSNQYTDEVEYEVANHDLSEGDIVVDLDFELPLAEQSPTEESKGESPKGNSLGLVIGLTLLLGVGVGVGLGLAKETALVTVSRLFVVLLPS